MGSSRAGVGAHTRLGCSWTATRMLLLLLVAVLSFQQAAGFTTTSTATAFISSPHRPTSTPSFVTTLDASTKGGVAPTTAAVEEEHGDDHYDLTLLSPCKINLFLRILGKREDGFHDLASLFQTIGFGDTLKFKMLSEDNDTDDEEEDTSSDEVQDLFKCNMKGVPLDKTNLVLRAVDLMRKKTGNTKQVRGYIFLIPTLIL
jgi:hypothetical protein